MKTIGFATMAAALALGGCASTGGGGGAVEVTRFHLGQPIAPGTVFVEPAQGAGLQARAFVPAVEAELARLGYPVSALESAGYIVAVELSSDTREGLRRRSPFSIGIGGGAGGYGSGGGGVGASVGLGGGGRRDTLVTRMSVQMKRRMGSDVVWEGRAEIETRARGDQRAVPGRLARALFRDFPGESGRTISVR